jgi:CRP/FNR family transcriptional regulator
MDTTSLLRKTQFCAGFSDDELARFTDLISPRKVRRGQLLFLEGDRADGFYLLLSGKVRLYKASPDGREQTLHVIGPGQSFADAAVFGDQKFPANCSVLEDSLVALVPRVEFMEMLAESPVMSLKIISSLSAFLREFNQIIENPSLKEVSARLATYLINLYHQAGQETFNLPTTKGELARRLGTVNETLSRNLRRLRHDGLIKVDGRRITILDPVRLSEAAASEKD